MDKKEHERKAEVEEDGCHYVSREHFYYWVACCRLWKKFLCLGDWEVGYNYIESDEDSPRASMEVSDAANRLAQLSIYDSWDHTPTDYYLFRTAFHEVLEMLFADVHILAQSRNFDYIRYDREHHRIIRIFEGSFFDDMWERKHELFNFQSDDEGGCIARPEVPEFHSKTDLHVSWLQRAKQGARRWINRLSPF